MSVLTRDQADLLAAYGWQTADMLLDPAAGIAAAKASSSSRRGSDGWNWDTSGRCLTGWRGRGPRPADVFVTWPEIRAAAKALPAPLVADLAAARRRTQREWLRHFPDLAGWAPGGRAAWVAPPPEWHRDAQAAERQALAAALDALVREDDLGVFGDWDAA